MPGWRKPLFVLALLIPGILFLRPAESFACSCATLTPDRALEIHDVVFSGRVYEIHPPTSTPNQQDSGSLVQNSFEVKEVWKGELDRTVDIRAAQSTASCGYQFAIDEEYLVYAYYNGDWLETGSCSLTKPLSMADEDLSVLGAGQTNPLYGKIPHDEEPAKFHSALVYVISVVVVLIAASGIIWWRRT